MANSKILTQEQEMQLRQPIDEYVGKIQKQIDDLRREGTDRVIAFQNSVDVAKRDKTLTTGERENRISECRAGIEKAKKVEAANKDSISKLIADAESYIKAHYDSEYFQPVQESCAPEKAAAQEIY